jgi:pullulanase
MFRKYMIDSLKFWATEYNISGFRFDLMALHDVETMNQIRDAVNQIDPTIILYGEPWMGGSSPLSSTIQANKNNMSKLSDNIASFNDNTRDAIKKGWNNKN